LTWHELLSVACLHRALAMATRRGRQVWEMSAGKQHFKA